MNDDLQSYIEPELEARIVALVLGEASAFEAEELERLIEERPELRAYRERIEKTHLLVGEAFEEKDNTDWQLSEERWEKVSSKIEEQKRKQEAHRARQRQKQITRQKLVYACAACLVIAMVIFVLGGATYTMGTVGESSASFEAKSEPQMSREESLAQLDAEIIAQNDLVQDHRKDLTVLIQQYGIPYFEGGDSNPLGATEQQMFQSARQKHSQLETQRDQIQKRLKDLDDTAMASEGQVLKTKAELLDRQINKMEEMVSNRKDDTVELSLRQNTYNQAKETLEQSRNMLRELKLAKAHALGGVEPGSSPGRQSQRVKKQSISDALVTIDEQIGSNDKGFGFDLPDGVLLSDWKVSSEEAKDRLWHNQGQPQNDAWSSFISGNEGGKRRTVTRSKSKDVSVAVVDDGFSIDELHFAESAFPSTPATPGAVAGGADVNGIAANGKTRGRFEATFAKEGETATGGSSGYRLAGEKIEQDESRKTALGLETMDPASQPKDGELHWNFEDARQDSESVAVPRIVTGGTRSTRSRASKKQLSDSQNRPKGSYAYWADSQNQKADTGRPDAFLTDVIDEESSQWGTEPQQPAEEVETVSRGLVKESDDLVDVKKVVRREIPVIPPTPASPLRSVITANETLPPNLPAPIAAAPDSSVKLGDDFGNGRNNRETVGYESLVQQESIRRQLDVQTADEKLVEGREAYADGNYDAAVQKYREALDSLPYGTATADRRAVLSNHLADGSVALTQKFRRLGKNDEARNLLNEVEKNSPGSVAATKGLEYLDDPIRTNPSQNHNHSNSVDMVRRNLYEGEGFYDLGLYDKAENKFKEVIRIDPYNKAARRWMERTGSIKSDYYRAAYDQTRAEMLMEVDRKWELESPPLEESDNFSSLEEFHKMTGTTATALTNTRDGGLQENLSAYLTANPEPSESKGRDSTLQTAEDSLFGDGIPVVTEDDPFADSGGGADSFARQEPRSERAGRTITTLNETILPELNLENATVEEAIALIEGKMSESRPSLDPIEDDLKFGVRTPRTVDSDGADFGEAVDPGQTRIKKLDLKNVPAKVALDYIAAAAKLRYKIEGDGKVTLLPLGGGEDDDIVQRRWQVPSTFSSFLSTSGGGGGGDDDPFAEESEDEAGGIKPREDITTLLKQNGVSFPEGTTANYLAGSNTLIIRNSATNLELIDGIVGAFGTDRKAEAAQEIVGDVGVRSSINKGRQIIIPEVRFKNTTMEEALDFVRLTSIELDNTILDEDRRGVNLVSDGSVALSRVLPDMNLKNVSLMEVLEKIGEVTGTSLEIGDFAYRFSKGSPPAEVLDRGSDGEADRYTRAKMHKILLPEIILNDATLEETLEFLRLRSQELDLITLDENLKGFEIMIEDPKLEKEILQGRKIAQLKLKNVPILVAVEEIARQTGCKVRIDNGKVIFFSDPARVATELPEGFETSTAEKSDSTFSLNVSDVSFKLAKAALAEGSWPDASKVRAEEFVNALDYDDSKPSQEEKVACVIEQGAHPFMQQRNLMRIAMSTASLGRNASTPLRLTILLDQSGSMERADRVESVKRAFALLSAQLNANDEVTLIGFARTSRLLAERLKGDQAAKLAEIVANPLSEGGTNLEAALSSGLQLAKQQFVEGAQNRIILLTDGAANLGDALPENLARQVETMRKNDIAFDACGVGANGLNDEILSSLAKQGDGRYYFLDRPEDADDGFAKQIAGALRPAAKNVKVQILFNPERVSKFKLYGFEKHKLKKEDFRNDAVDAAEMAAEESGIALYHFETLPEGRGDIGTVSVRFLDTASKQMVERTWAIPYQKEAALFSKAKPTLRLAGIAGLFAEKLKGTPVGERVDLKRLRQETELLKPTFDHQPRFHELKQMLQQAGQ